VIVKWFDDNIDRKQIELADVDLKDFFDFNKKPSVTLEEAYGFILPGSNLLDFKRIEKFEYYIRKMVMDRKREESNVTTEETLPDEVVIMPFGDEPVQQQEEPQGPIEHEPT
jgi:hypothetical protein